MPKSVDIGTEEDDDLSQDIKDQVNEWSSNSNECFTIQMVRGEDQIISSFKPEYSYAMFGEEEAIFGYQGLAITLSFVAHSLEPHLKIDYDNIFEAQGEVRPTDVQQALEDFLPASAFGKQRENREDTTGFKPPGQKIHDYTRSGRKFETWCSSLADPLAKKLLRNMQILVPMYIDGGRMLELEFDWTTQRWKLFLVYEVDKTAADGVSPYILAGFGTSYRIFTLPDRQSALADTFSSSLSLDKLLPAPDSDPNKLSVDPELATPLDLPSRERLSQFLILPSHRAFGHGQELYNVMYKHLSSPKNICEFTVEDPNEKFDNMRDFCDLLYLRANFPDFAALRINTDVPADRLGLDAFIPTDLIVSIAVREDVMRRTKIVARQFDRLVEMHTLSFIPSMHRNRTRITRKEKSADLRDRAYFFWRLYAKQRLFIHNRDQLLEIQPSERVEKLDAALDSVQEQYEELIEKVEQREQEIAARVAGSQSLQMRKKRKVIDDDEDDEEGTDGAGSAADEINGHSKKTRVA